MKYRTLNFNLTFEGIGVFSGHQSRVTLIPLTPSQIKRMRMRCALGSNCPSRGIFFYPMEAQETILQNKKDGTYKKDGPWLDQLIDDDVRASHLFHADLEHVLDTEKRTTAVGLKVEQASSHNAQELDHLSCGKSEMIYRISTVEHLLAALKGDGIQDLLIVVEGGEVPIFDGSSQRFTEEIRRAVHAWDEPVDISLESASLRGVSESSATKIDTFACDLPIELKVGSSLYTYIPKDDICHSSSMSACIDYSDLAGGEMIGVQQASFMHGTDDFMTTIASARTFCLKSEYDLLTAQAVIKGGDFLGTMRESALVIDGHKVMNGQALRYENEMARHKLLDMIGDFSLLNYDIEGHIIAIKPSHSGNIAFAKHLKAIAESENLGMSC